jgi:hypothetical protein
LLKRKVYFVIYSLAKILLHVLNAMFLRYCPRANEYGASLVTGLLKHISTGKIDTKTEHLNISISFEVLP